MFSLFPLASIVFGLLQITSSYVYHQDLAEGSLHLAQASYCVNNTLEWRCPTCTSENILDQVITNRGSQAIVGINKPTNSIFVAFEKENLFPSKFSKVPLLSLKDLYNFFFSSIVMKA